jgi:hypothetical protein
MRRSLVIMAAMMSLMLQGCIPDLRSDNVMDPAAVTGTDVAVTPEATPADDATRLQPAMVDAAETAAPTQEKATDAPLTPLAEDVAAAPDAEVVPEEPQAPQSAEQQQCEKKGGKWALLGKTKARTCLRQTRDSGKFCDNKDDCDGQCLSRSKTCAPFDPLLGCNDVIQDNGATVSLCID